MSETDEERKQRIQALEAEFWQVLEEIKSLEEEHHIIGVSLAGTPQDPEDLEGRLEAWIDEAKWIVRAIQLTHESAEEKGFRVAKS